MSETALLGTKVGHIRIVGFIAEGGMGSVFAGFDEKLERRVAVKAIVEGQRLDSVARTRFLREARILSQLQHPNICQIYDYVEEQGREFLVLEHVEGASLRELIPRGLDRAHKARIAAQVVDVLAAAHARGIIHRDLKPGNVMLTRDGAVKVLDFGLARAVVDQEAQTADSGELDLHSGPEHRSDYFVTKLGVLVGTLSYMSPEQARGEPSTPASDMYSFGLLLQELHTGQPPYERELPRATRLEKAQDGETLPVTGVAPDLTALINRLKALPPGARPSAMDTAEHLRRIREAPRRRLKRLLTSVSFVVLTAIAGIMTFQASRISQEAERANREAEVARQVSRFLVELFEVSDPGEARGNAVTAREILDTAASRIDRELGGQPLIQAQLLDTIGSVYQKLGLYRPSLPLLQRALEIRTGQLGADDPLLATSLANLATLHWYDGDYDRAGELYQQALDIRERALGSDHPDVADILFDLGSSFHQKGDYDRAAALYQRALQIRERALGPSHPDVALSLNNLGVLYHEKGELDRTAKLWQRALAIDEQALGPDHPDLTTKLHNLSALFRDRGEYERARALSRRALAIEEKTLGPDHPGLVLTLHGLASISQKQGQLDDTEALLERALEISERTLGPDHPDLGMSLHLLASLRLARGELARAEGLLERALEVRERLLDGPEDSLATGELASTLVLLGRALEARKGALQARAPWVRARDLLEPISSSPDPPVRALREHATVLILLGQVEEAEPVVARALDAGERTAGFLDLCRQHGLLPEESGG